ncbi:MAG: hypothetical protein JSS89_13155 [Bacteroidetes bacterium]|nr:hypothetical protein [Bacteroidota bacterium]
MPKTIWHTKKRILTEAEMRVRKDSIVEHMQKINEIRALKKIEDKKFANQLKPHQTLVDEMMEQISTGVDEGKAQCEVQVDAVTQTVRFIKVDRKWNEELNDYEYSRELFDEKTFEEVGEKQLSMWQDMEVDDSVDSLWSVLAENERDALSDLDADETIDWPEAVGGLLTPMSGRAAALFLRLTGKPDVFVIQVFKNVGLREALELIEDCRLKVLLGEDEGVEEEFMSGVFSDVEVGRWLLENTINIPHRKAESDIDGINFHSDEIPDGEVLTPPVEVGDE